MTTVTHEPDRLASVKLAPAYPPPPDPRFARPPGQLCQLASDWRRVLPPAQWIAQQKIDGIRALWLGGDLVTREGIPIAGTDHIRAEILELERAAGERLFVDGEFQVDGTLAATARHFQRRGRYGDAGTLFVFDVLPHTQWLANAPEKPLTARAAQLQGMIDLVQPKSICVIPSRSVANAGDVVRLAETMWRADLEGLVVKRSDARYERRRSNSWLKVKRRVKMVLAPRSVRINHRARG
jgi:ATP-dependent DNA ligase